jgi:hypothetical protein
MGGPYFQKQPWRAFSYQGTTYDLSHLDEFLFSVQDQRGVVRTIVVTFEDHCFTRDWEQGDHASLIYPGCSRNPGCFDFDRYACSLGIAQRLTAAASRKVY